MFGELSLLINQTKILKKKFGVIKGKKEILEKICAQNKDTLKNVTFSEFWLSLSLSFGPFALWFFHSFVINVYFFFYSIADDLLDGRMEIKLALFPLCCFDGRCNKIYVFDEFGVFLFLSIYVESRFLGSNPERSGT